MLLSNVFNLSLFKFKKSTPVFGSLVNDGVKESYIKALASLKSYKSRAKKENILFKLLSNGNLCIANRNNNETMVKITVLDKELNKLAETPCPMFYLFRECQLVELNNALFLCLYGLQAGANNFRSSKITKYDFNLNVIDEMEFAFEINYADVHDDKLYLLGTSSDRKSRNIFVYDESLMFLENMPISSREDEPFYVPDSVTKMKITEKYFVFLDGENVLLIDRLDEMIKRTFSIGSSDFLLDSSNDRIIAHDDELERLVCFNFEGESFEIPISKLKNVELVDYAYERFVFYNADSFCLHF